MGTYPIWGLKGSKGPFLTTIKKGKTLKLGSNIIIHKGQVDRNCHFPANRKVFIFIFLRAIGNVISFLHFVCILRSLIEFISQLIA